MICAVQGWAYCKHFRHISYDENDHYLGVSLEPDIVPGTRNIFSSKATFCASESVSPREGSEGCVSTAGRVKLHGRRKAVRLLAFRDGLASETGPSVTVEGVEPTHGERR